MFKCAYTHFKPRLQTHVYTIMYNPKSIKRFSLSLVSFYLVSSYQTKIELYRWLELERIGTENHSTYLYTQCLFGLVQETIRLICILNVCFGLEQETIRLICILNVCFGLVHETIRLICILNVGFGLVQETIRLICILNVCFGLILRHSSNIIIR